jgi:hypothetical protein
MDNPQMPAYPVTSNNGLTGLTKLEAFTIAAMQGLCANPNVVIHEQSHNVVIANGDIALTAYLIARDTLSELSKNQ